VPQYQFSVASNLSDEAIIFIMEDMSLANSSQYWSRAGSLVGLPDVARELGHDPTPMLERFGFSANVLADPDAQLSYPALCRMLDTCAAEWACPDFALRLANRQNLNMLGPIGLVARISDTVGNAFKALVDHARLHSNGFDIYLNAKADEPLASIMFIPRPKSGTGTQMHMLYVAVVKNINAFVIGDPNYRPRRIHLALSPTSVSTSAIKRHFGCPVIFGEEHTEIVFESSCLSQTTAIHDEAYAPLVRTYLQHMEQQFSADEVQATRRLISQLIATGRCTREVVARYLNMHPRTLHRRLSDHGVNFAELVDEHRRERATEMVSQGSLPLKQIADALGFSSQSAFNQAFKRWTNASPRRFQRLSIE
jgi:AraC-like DNA-binding protein